MPEKVLAIFAQPHGVDPLRLGEEHRVIHECLQQARQHRMQVDVRHAASIHDVRRALLNGNWGIVHFSGHGTEHGLLLEDENGEPQPVSTAALMELLAAYSPPLHTVVLHACLTGAHPAGMAAARIPYVIANDGPILDAAAIEFTRGFYDALAAGRDVPFAYQEGCRTVRLMGLEDEGVPVLHRGPPPTAREQTGEHFYVFITGSNSVGKSTVAYALTERYHFNAIVSTDSLRAALRPWAREIGAPELLYSSFEVSDRLRELNGVQMGVEEAFEKQCISFCRSFEAVIEHSRRKRATAVFEGVNILPTEAFRRVAFHEKSDLLLVTLYLADRDQHYQRMLTRITDMPGPEADKYPRNFNRIRLLDDFVVRRTREFEATTRGGRVLVIENSGTVTAAVDQIARRLEEVRALVAQR